MNDVGMIGLGLAKGGQVSGFFAKLAPCLVGTEARASSHFWRRERHAARSVATGSRVVHRDGQITTSGDFGG